MARTPRTVVLLGQRFPWASVGLSIALLVVSILAVNVPLVASVTLLRPSAVWAGELWLLLTWPFLAPEPLGLIFGCLLLMFLGRDLVYAWGVRRFLLCWFGLSAATGASLCASAYFWEPLMGHQFIAPWALLDALIVAWALMFPTRQIFVMFVVPLAGRHLIWATVAFAVLFGLMEGIAGAAPHLIAMGLMALYLRNRNLETFWLRLRYRMLQLRQGRRRSHLRAVERDDSEPPRWVH